LANHFANCFPSLPKFKETLILLKNMGGKMSLVRKFGLAILGVAFSLGVFVTTSNAQWSNNRSWQNRSYQTRNWQNRRYRTSRISPQEYRRLSRQRSRIYRSTRRAYRDGYVSPNERRRLYRQTQRYRNNVRRDRRDWN
jgi:hypothetical protein